MARALVAATVGMSLSGCRADTADEAPATLRPAHVVDAAIAPGETHSYRLYLEVGQAARVKLDQGVEDLALSLWRPDATAAETFDRRERGPETATVIARSAGIHEIRVVAPRPLGTRAPYRLAFDALPHRVEERDRLQAEAEALETRAKTVPASARAEQKAAALDLLNEALRRWRALADESGQATTLARMGDMMLAGGRFGDAGAAYEEALALPWTHDQDVQQAVLLTNFGVTQGRRGLLADARASFGRALVIWRARNMVDPDAAATLINEGSLLFEAGEYREALARFLPAQDMLRARRDRREAFVLSNIGMTYGAMGDLEGARTYLTRAVERFHAADNAAERPATARAQVRLGQVALDTGDTAAAEANGREALALVREAGDPIGEGGALDLLGQVAAAASRESAALEMFGKALEVYTKADMPRGIGTALHHLGALHRSKGRPTQARVLLERGLAIREKVGFRDAEAESHYELGLAYRDLAALTPAASHLRQASDLLDDLRGRVAGEYSRLMYVAARRRYFAAYVDTLMQLHETAPAAGYATLAFEASERDRARVLIDALVESGVDIRRDADPALIEKARDLRGQLDFWSAQLARHIDRKSPPDAIARARQHVDDVLLATRETEARLRSQSPLYMELTHGTVLPLARIQRDIVDRDTILLRYFLGDRRSYVWLVTPDSLDVAFLPPKAVIERHVWQAVADVRSRTDPIDGHGRPFGDAGRALSDVLFGGIAARLGAKRLLLVCDGDLQRVPFAALPLPGSAEPFVARHEIVMLPSASTMAALRRRAATRPPPARTLALLADPVYESADPRLPRWRRASPDPSRPAGAPSLGRLPLPKSEGQVILGLVPSAQRLTAVGFAANRDDVLGGLLRDYAIVHVAAHAIVDEARPELSSIVLSQYRSDGTPTDGRLRLGDIASLDLRASLVVLGACESTTGQDVPGEGLMGLARGFLAAGTGAVVGSLFPIEEEQTLEFMQAFYAELLGSPNRSPASALRSAQLRMLERPRFRDPFFWSAFVIIGDSR